MSEHNPYQSPDPACDAEEPPRETPEGYEKPRPLGFGGWLILVGIKVVVYPFELALIGMLSLDPIFRDGTWQALTTPEGNRYHRLWAAVLSFNIIMNLSFFVLSIVTLIFFLRKSRYFPRIYIADAVASLTFLLLYTWFVACLSTNELTFKPDTTTEITRSLMHAGVWIPYMLFSKRVNNTFVE